MDAPNIDFETRANSDTADRRFDRNFRACAQSPGADFVKPGGIFDSVGFAIHSSHSWPYVATQVCEQPAYSVVLDKQSTCAVRVLLPRDDHSPLEFLPIEQLWFDVEIGVVRVPYSLAEHPAWIDMDMTRTVIYGARVVSPRAEPYLFSFERHKNSLEA